MMTVHYDDVYYVSSLNMLQENSTDFALRIKNFRMIFAYKYLML